MTLVALQPAGGDEAEGNYAKTIAQTVPLESIEGFLDPDDHNALAALFPSGSARFWGVTPGRNKRKANAHGRLSEGDLVLFSKEGAFFASARIRFAFRNEKAAQKLWGIDKVSGETWELMFAIDDIQEIENVPVADVVLGRVWEKKRFVQSFTVPDEDISLAVLTYLEFISEDEAERIALTRAATHRSKEPASKESGYKAKDSSPYESHTPEQRRLKSRTHEKVIDQFVAMAAERRYHADTTKVHPRDLVLTRNGETILVEAKMTYDDRPYIQVREAIGQLFMYRHTYYKDKNHQPTLLAVFSKKISNEHQDLLTTLGIAFVYRKTVDGDTVTWEGSQSARDVGLIA